MFTLDESLALVADWHKALDGGADMRAVSVDQIAQIAAKSPVTAHG